MERIRVQMETAYSTQLLKVYAFQSILSFVSRCVLPCFLSNRYAFRFPRVREPIEMDAYWFYHEDLEEEAALRVGCLFTAIVRLNRSEAVRWKCPRIQSAFLVLLSTTRLISACSILLAPRATLHWFSAHTSASC